MSRPRICTLKDFDDLLEVIKLPTHHEQADDLCNKLAIAVEYLKISHAQVIEELLTMYQSAAEHNVDVGRDAVYKLAKRMAGHSTDDT